MSRKYHTDWHPNATEDEQKELNENLNYVLRAWEYYRKNKDIIYAKPSNQQNEFVHNNQNNYTHNSEQSYRAYYTNNSETNKSESKNGVLDKLIKKFEKYLRIVIKKGKTNPNAKYVILKGGLSLSVNIIKSINIKLTDFKVSYSKLDLIISNMTRLRYEIENSEDKMEILKKKTMMKNLSLKAKDLITEKLPNLSNKQKNLLLNYLFSRSYKKLLEEKYNEKYKRTI